MGRCHFAPSLHFAGRDRGEDVWRPIRAVAHAFPLRNRREPYAVAGPDHALDRFGLRAAGFFGDRDRRTGLQRPGAADAPIARFYFCVVADMLRLLIGFSLYFSN